MNFLFDANKNEWLKKERAISFEEIILLINEEGLVDILDHPNQKKYPGQKIYVVDVDGYAYLIPFEIDDESIYLKTIYPSRKATKEYIKKGDES